MAGFQKNAFEDEARKILREYNAAYQQAGETLIAAVIANIDRGMKPSEAVREALASTDFEAQIQKALSDATYLAACAGYGILPFMVADAAGKGIRRKLSDSWAQDNVKLSDRLHAIDVQEKVVQTIQAFLRKSEATRDLAKKLYDGYGLGGDLSQAELPKYLKELLNLARQATNNDPDIMRELRQKAGKANQAAKKLSTRNLQAAYYGLVDACGDKLKQTAIEKAARVAIEEKTRYYAERIARTETARAWFDGFLASTQNDKDVWGYRWVLSSRHKFACFDSCDLCAYGNVGYGAGIYPKNKVPPIPQHPHCMCSLVTVIVGETKGQDKEFDADGVTKYIDGLSDKERRQLFGVEGAKKYRAGGNWQKLARGWQGYGKPQGRLKDEDFKIKLVESKNPAIIRVTKTKLFAEPNSITERISKKGGVERNYYDSNGRQYKQVANNNHGNAKEHPFGKHGEHAHDYVYDAAGHLIDRPKRELTKTEREENQDIL